MKSVCWAILTAPLITVHRSKAPAQQRLKGHMRLVHIHDCPILWVIPQPLGMSNMSLQWNMSLEIPTSVREHLNFVFQFMTPICCQMPNPLPLAISRNAMSGLPQGMRYFHTHTLTCGSCCLSSSPALRQAWWAGGSIWGSWGGKSKVVSWREAFYWGDLVFRSRCHL